MDMGQFNLFIKMIQDEYKLSDAQLTIITHRMLADDKEFERVWKSYKTKTLRYAGGVDDFKSLLGELLS